MKFILDKISITILILSFSLSSCLKTKKIDEQILGEWKFVGYSYPKYEETSGELVPPPQFENPFQLTGFHFREGGVGEMKPGFYQNMAYNKITKYLGSRSIYKIEGDSLKFFDLSDSTWISTKIHSIENDTLTFAVGNEVYSKFVRVNYKVIAKNLYDKVVVSSSGCYGTCPISDIIIGQDGEILYSGERFNTKNGIYKSVVSAKQLEEIETAFQKSNFINLEENYQADWTDDEEISISFIKDGKIIKTINDYGRQAPVELLWAYTSVRYLYQSLNLIPYSTEKKNLAEWRFNFETDSLICVLSKSESYFLISELFKAKEVTNKFEHKYFVDHWYGNDKPEVIYTDGRYYQMNTESGVITVDIGYNFISENGMVHRFRKKDNYEL